MRQPETEGAGVTRGLMRVLMIGCGYLGLPLGEGLAASGAQVAALRRTATAHPSIHFIRADITEPATLERIEPAFDVVINMVSSSRGGADDYRRVYLEGTRNVLEWLERRPPELYLYTSSTSVYGQEDGSWVTEESPAEPGTPTGRILLETERQLLSAFATASFPAIILRVAGIYGPDRGHLLKQFLRDEATLRGDGSTWMNSIHVDDVVRAITHLLTAGSRGEIYNVTDDEPVQQCEFFRWLAAKLQKPMPPSAPPDPARKRGLTNKRVSNARLRATGFELQYPTFREGYAAELRRRAAL